MDLTHSDVDRILKIIDASGYDEINLEVGDFKLHVRRTAVAGNPESVHAPAPAQPALPAVAASPAARAEPAATTRADERADGLVAVRSPVLGTFYRAPSLGAKPFVEVGDRVKASDTVCLVEVMKLFNSVQAGVDGIVVKIVAENGSMVEFNQVLLLIEHSLLEDDGQTE